MMSMKPLRVSFLIRGGIVAPAYPIHLDALLAYAVTQRELSDIEEEPSIEALRELGSRLPLEKHHQDGDSVWMSSALVSADKIQHEARFYTQRMDEYALARHALEGAVKFGRYNPAKVPKPYEFRIETARGVFRNLLGTYPVLGLQRLDAWCIGDKERIEEIFEYGYITHIGARSRTGHGVIDTIEVAEDSIALENWKLRTRPWKLLPSDVPVQAACEAPYWLAENKRLAWTPLDLSSAI